MPQYQRKLKKGLRWYYKFSYLGQVYHSKAIYRTKQDAKRAERVRVENIEKESRNITNRKLTLLELINERLDYIKTAKSEKYYKESKHYLQILFNYFGNVPVSNITKGEVQKLLISQSKALQKKKRDNYAVNALLRDIRSLFYYGIHYCDLYLPNPCLGIKKFSIRKKLKYIPSDKEIESILKQCDEEQKLLVEFVIWGNV